VVTLLQVAFRTTVADPTVEQVPAGSHLAAAQFRVENHGSGTLRMIASGDIRSVSGVQAKAILLTTPLGTPFTLADVIGSNESVTRWMAYEVADSFDTTQLTRLYFTLVGGGGQSAIWRIQ